MLNGDDRLSAWEKVRYFWQCVRAHSKGDNTIATKTLQLSSDGIGLNKGSPSRMLCDLFWENIDFDKLSSTLYGDIHFFDVGCGAGDYGSYLKKLSKNQFGSYTGLDINKNERFPNDFTHVLSDAAFAAEYVPAHTNFVMSQSALEHIEEDLRAVETITEKLVSYKKPFIQIHVVPARLSLWLYLLHGWRQYSAANLGTLFGSLSAKYNLEVYAVPLGGRHSFISHLLRITLPSMIFKKKINHQNLNRKFSDAVVRDLKNSHSKFNTFWVCVIASSGVDPGLNWDD